MEIIISILVLCITLFSVAAAGDLEELPDNDKDFRTKIESFIKPGGNLKDAVRLLESYRFECSQKKGDTSGIWCSRSDPQAMSSVVRRYQVIVRSKGKTIISVQTSMGFTGP